MKRPDRAWVSTRLLIVAVSLSAAWPGHAADRTADGPSIVVFAVASLTDAVQNFGGD
jgi:ABC-type molybdate transport system substrate-binding protein